MAGLGSSPMEQWNGPGDTRPLSITFLLSTLHKIRTLNTLNECITSRYEGARNNLCGRLKLPALPARPCSSNSCRQGMQEGREDLRSNCSQASLGEKGGAWEFGLKPWFHPEPYPPVLSFCVNSFSEQQGEASLCLLVTPLGNQIFRGRWEAAERQLEPWWAVCHPACHPLFPLWSSFLLLYRQLSLQVPRSMYPLENIYNLLTSWGHFF